MMRGEREHDLNRDLRAEMFQEQKHTDLMYKCSAVTALGWCAWHLKSDKAESKGKAINSECDCGVTFC